jgi:cytochrome c oxidase cbb3-type subunit II
MSDLLSSAATALGLPEALVRRSAEARATATGSSIDEILAAWAGGEIAAPTAAEASSFEPDEAPPEPDTKAGALLPMIEDPSAPQPAPLPAPVERAQPGGPPVLIGAEDNPMTTFVGAVALFAMLLLVGLVGPAIAEDVPGERTTEIAHTEAGRVGQSIYERLGCAGCHTQMVRPVVADVGLGAVSLNDSNQVLGTRRFGPDLADVGSRLSRSETESIIAGFGGHPASSLSSRDLNDLVTYLAESSTSDGAG